MSLDFTAPPTLPSLSEPATFNARAITLFNWFRDTFIPELEALTTADLLQLLPDGTALLPGLAFQADPDTGLHRPGANQLGISTGGTRRVLLDSTAMQVDVPITGTAAQSSLNDATSGKLMKVGGHGIGGAPIAMSGSGSIGSRDLATGAHSFGVSQPGGPEGLAYAYCAWLIENFTNRRHFLAFRDGSAQTDLFAWIGHQQEADGSINWHKLVSLEAGVVGTVAQTGGVPTGKIIEQGSNANGSYTKFADGTMMCWRKVSHDMDTGAAQDWLFPVTFAANAVGGVCGVNVGTGAIAIDWADHAGNGWANGTTKWSTRAPNGTPSGVGNTVELHLFAIGRWF